MVLFFWPLDFTFVCPTEIIAFSDRDGVIRHMLVNDLSLGRSVDEALRMADALQFFEKNGKVCPANWRPGEPTIKPDAQKSKECFRAVAAGR